MKTEYTSPDWYLWEQRQLAPYQKTALNTATNIAKTTLDVLATQVAPKVAVTLKPVRSKAMTLLDMIARNYKEIFRAFLGTSLIFLAVSIPVMYAAYHTPDSMLDRALAINTEVTSILRNISVREMPLQRMAEEVSGKDSLIRSLVISNLPDRAEIATHMHDERNALKSLGKEIEDLRFQAQWLGLEVYNTHEKALFYLRRRSDLPRSRLHRYFLQVRTPTLKDIREGLVDEPLRLSDMLELPIDVATAIEMDLEALARQLERTEWHLGRSQQTWEGELRALHNATMGSWWSGWWFRGPSKAHEQMLRDIETAAMARNRTRELQQLVASVPVRAVQEDLRRARAGLRLVEAPVPLLGLKVFFFAGVTARQEAAVERVVELASFFDRQPQLLPDGLWGEEGL
ncbi:hypothetical protein PG985_005068 [Apiospora marii]|uniref:Uncharacterized protein n=1 Tax=Apiospora marii TaxID=335849 RepID=A0ABR1SAS3_9PEZI